MRIIDRLKRAAGRVPLLQEDHDRAVVEAVLDELIEHARESYDVKPAALRWLRDVRDGMR